MAATEGKSDLPRWHRVCLNTIVRKGMALDSERLRILPMGSKVWVVEQQERRVRIDRPIVGWCSLKSSNGDTILTPLEKTVEEEASQTPSSGNLQDGLSKAQKQYDTAASNLASAAMNVGDGVDPNKKEEMMQMVANGELGQLQGQLDALKSQYDAEQNQNEQHLEEFENAIKEARDAKLHADSVKALAEAKMRELNVLKNQFVEMFTKMEGDETSKEAAEHRPRSDGGVLLLYSNDIVVCRYEGKIPEAEDPEETYLGVLYDQPFGNTDGRFVKNDEFGTDYYMRCQMGFGKYIKPTEIKRRLFADQLLHRLSNAMNLYVQNQSVVEGSQQTAEN